MPGISYFIENNAITYSLITSENIPNFKTFKNFDFNVKPKS